MEDIGEAARITIRNEVLSLLFDRHKGDGNAIVNTLASGIALILAKKVPTADIARSIVADITKEILDNALEAISNRRDAT